MVVSLAVHPGQGWRGTDASARRSPSSLPCGLWRRKILYHKKRKNADDQLQGEERQEEVPKEVAERQGIAAGCVAVHANVPQGTIFNPRPSASDGAHHDELRGASAMRDVARDGVGTHAQPYTFGYILLLLQLRNADIEEGQIQGRCLERLVCP